MKNKLFFLIGLRRSGTSITRELLLKSPGVTSIAFEPHDLWSAVDLNHFPRLIKDSGPNSNFQWVSRVLSDYKELQYKDKWHGVKFALNPGVKALEWRWLYRTFPGAYFIFILRNIQSTWKSYLKQDLKSFRGVIPRVAYELQALEIIEGFIAFNMNRPKQSTILYYEKILSDPDTEMKKAFDLLDIPAPERLKSLIKKPEF